VADPRVVAGPGLPGRCGQCRRACRNFANLVELKAVEVEIAAARPDQRDALRKTQTEAFDHRIDVCLSECVSANDKDAIDCLIAAKSAAQAHACTSSRRPGATVGGMSGDSSATVPPARRSARRPGGLARSLPPAGGDLERHGPRTAAHRAGPEVLGAEWPQIHATVLSVMLGVIVWWVIEVGLVYLTALWETEHDHWCAIADCPGRSCASRGCAEQRACEVIAATPAGAVRDRAPGGRARFHSAVR